MNKLTHLNQKGEAHMVDIDNKEVTDRRAIAEGFVTVKESTVKTILDGKLPKGDLFGSARIAGIMAAKKTSELIPLCHILPISSVNIEINIIKCDITNSKQISKIIMKFKPNIIIHLAGPGGNVECQNDPKNAISVNVLGTLNILEASKKINSKIIFA